MQINISSKKDKKINPGMIGLFFEDINYAADGGLYAELIENRSFNFVKAMGDAKDYYTVPAGDYGWSLTDNENVSFKIVSGSPLSESNPNYMRLNVNKPFEGVENKAYEGIAAKQGTAFQVVMWARPLKMKGNFVFALYENNELKGESVISALGGTDEKPNFWKLYCIDLVVNDDVKNAKFRLFSDSEGTFEIGYVSLIPKDAVMGIFRKDLFDKLNEIHPGFIRFPGGCIIEGNTLSNRYRFKETLKPTWDRKTNWNRWAVHGNCKDNEYTGKYAWYNQTLGLGFYEYFLLCEKLGASPLPVLNVGFACQYQSLEMVPIDSPEFEEFVQDALDLVSFANDPETKGYGKIRAKMGHPAPFNLKMLGIGNEQWQTEKADFFERYTIFEKRIHEKYPKITLIGSAGPDITSERYTKAWEFYRKNKNIKNFVYALDEHYYVKPEWLFAQNEFYDNYDRDIKVFSGEYAAHPVCDMNRPDANTLWGALSEASFMTGVERNADVVVLASYAPLFARLNYAQWSPDMIWFNNETSYGSPSFHVQKMFAGNMGTYTLKSDSVIPAREEGIYFVASYDEGTKETIVKIVNANECDKEIEFKNLKKDYRMTLLTGPCKDAYNSIDNPDNVTTKEITGSLRDKVVLPSLSFGVIRF